MQGKRRFNRRHLIWIVPLALVLAVGIAFLIYSAFYYHADAAALDALRSDGKVQVSRTDYGWYFDGPSEADALVFYPGAKVEETAYAPLLRGLAEAGMDACLVKMPLHFAFLGADKADGAMKAHAHARWFVGGHSLGGAIAADYAARHADRVAGVALLGAYGTRKLDDRLVEVAIYGTEDGLLSEADIARARDTAPARFVEHVIPGGNHAQFGNYGVQSRDGTAAISAEAQQAETIRAILEALADFGE